MSQHGQWPCGCGRRDHPPGACPKPMTATEVIARQNQAFSQPGPFASVLQPLVNRTMALMENRGLLMTTAEVEKLVRPPFLASVTPEMSNEPSSILPGRITYVNKLPEHAWSKDDIITLLRPVAPKEAYKFEPKTKLPEVKWRDATPEEIALTGLYQVSKETLISMAANQANYLGAPEIPVTEEMIEAGARAGFEEYYGPEPDTHAIWKADREEWITRSLVIYRAMAAKAIEAGTLRLNADQITWFNNVVALLPVREARIAALEARNERLIIERDTAFGMQTISDEMAGNAQVLIAGQATRIAELERDVRMLKADKVSDHDYHGPIKDGKAVPDESHERFHGSIGDVLSGNIIRPARDQMEKALADARAKDGKGVPSIPTSGRSSDPRRIGG